MSGAITATNFIELDEMLSGVLNNHDRNRLVSEVIRMSKWNFNLHEWNKEKMDELVRDETERILKEEKEQGIEQNTKDIILSLFENGSSLEFISKVTKKI